MKIPYGAGTTQWIKVVVSSGWVELLMTVHWTLSIMSVRPPPTTSQCKNVVVFIASFEWEQSLPTYEITLIWCKACFWNAILVYTTMKSFSFKRSWKLAGFLVGIFLPILYIFPNDVLRFYFLLLFLFFFIFLFSKKKSEYLILCSKNSIVGDWNIFTSEEGTNAHTKWPDSIIHHSIFLYLRTTS